MTAMSSEGAMGMTPVKRVEGEEEIEYDDEMAVAEAEDNADGNGDDAAEDSAGNS